MFKSFSALHILLTRHHLSLLLLAVSKICKSLQNTPLSFSEIFKPFRLSNFMNKDTQYLEEAYQIILEKSAEVCKHSKDGCDCNSCKDCKANQKESKKELSPKQKKIAQQAPPPDKITGADFAALKKKKVKEGFAFDNLFKSIIAENSKKVEMGPFIVSGPQEKSKKAFQVFQDLDGERIQDDVDYLVYKLDGTSDELLGKDVMKLDPFEIDFIQKSGSED